MFSFRTNWNFHSNDLTLLREKKIREGIRILDLTETNPTKCNFHFPFDEIVSSFNNYENIFYTPNPKGSLQARETICQYYSERNIFFSPEQIILTSSSSEAYSLLFRLLCNVDDEILVPKPSYPLFEYLAEINDVRIKHYRLEYDGSWNIDFQSIEKNLTEKTKAIILVNPNNPTGNFAEQEEQEKLFRIAKEKNVAIIEDEVFSDFRLKKANLTSHISNLHFRLNGISKMLALPQMKLGWIVAEGNEEQKQEALARLEILADTFLSVNTPIQNALPKLFSLRTTIQNEIISRIKDNYEFLKRATHISYLTSLNIEGGWSVILQIPATKTDEQCVIEILENENVFVHPGHFFDFEKEGYFVLSLLTERETFFAGVEKIVHFFSSRS
ncbi:MAG: pyridoxal phosphate-dependent aminotransferase [Ignavibacteria bacterium]|nr:pyridoxal phosphate-dependent aminotransferase [Ignavibacteria bacterium]